MCLYFLGDGIDELLGILKLGVTQELQQAVVAELLLTVADDDKQLRQVAEVFIAQRVHHGQCGQGLAKK